MESIPENILLRMSPGAIYDIRKIYNLKKPERIEQAVNILESWIRKQGHMIKKDFTLRELSSPEHVEYVKMMFEACSDENKRHAGKFNEEYMGMPGSFRCLNVDESVIIPIKFVLEN